MIHLQVSVLNAAELLDPAAYGAGALLRWESADAADGTYVEGGTLPLVSTQTLYDVWDAAGTATTWYRTRTSDAAGAVFSAYSAPFQGGTVTAYATLEEFLAGFESGVPGAARYARIYDALEQASRAIDAEVGWDFLRHPAISGDETRLYDGTGARRLHLHEGLVSVTSVRVAWSTADAVAGNWQTLLASDYYLEPSVREPGEPYDHLALSDWPSLFYVFPRGMRNVELTGAFGYAAVPSIIRRATVALARQIYRADSFVLGGSPGPDEFGGGAISPNVRPYDVYKAIERYRRRFWCHV